MNVHYARNVVVMSCACVLSSLRIELHLTSLRHSSDLNMAHIHYMFGLFMVHVRSPPQQPPELKKQSGQCHILESEAVVAKSLRDRDTYTA